MEEKELLALVLTANPNFDPDIFKVIIDLLKLDVGTEALFRAIQKLLQKSTKPKQ